MKLKSFIMILLIGSTFAFSHSIMRESVDKIQENTSKDTSYQFDKQEVIFWLAILSVLGISLIIMLQVMDAIFDLRLISNNYRYIGTSDESPV